MKKIIAVLMVVGMVLFPYAHVFAAAGSWSAVTYSDAEVSKIGNIKTFTITFTASSDNATIPTYTISALAQPTLMNFIKGYWIYTVETNPGTTGPTDEYDIVINDVHGLDVMGGALLNRSITSTQNVFPKFVQTATAFVPLDGTTLSIVVTNNAVNSATCAMKFYLTK